MQLVIFCALFILGLFFGSFLNVVIFWLESRDSKQLTVNSKQGKRKSLLGRSFCPHCKYPLGFWDLIPVFSWIFLRARCRYCKKPISIQYPLVELGTGLLFAGSISYGYPLLAINNFSSLMFQLKTITMLIINCLLLIVFVYDLKHKIIPDRIIYPAIVLAAIYSLLVISNSQNSILQLSTFVLSALGAGSFFYFLAAISDGKWMGGGDIKLAFLMGLLLGFPTILVGLFLGFVFGALAGILLIIFKKAKMQNEIPFAPFLITGTWVALFFGEKLIQLYMKMFL